MKRTLLLSIFCLLLASAQAQNHQKDIQNTLSDYVGLIQNQQYMEAMEYINPAIFDIVPKDLMVSTFESLHENPALRFAFGKFEVKEISDLFTHEGDSFARVSYLMDLDLTLPEVDAENLPMMLNVFEMQYGEGMVTLNEETKTFHIQTLNTMIAQKLGGNWKFIESKPEMKTIMDKVIPIAVQEALIVADN